MDEIINRFKRLLLSIVILIVSIVAGVSFSVVEYVRISDKFTQIDQLLEVENYDEATDILGNLQTNWLVTSVGIKALEIQDDLEEVKIRQNHKEIYENGTTSLAEADWQEAIINFSEIPEDSFYYQRAQTKIEEAKRRTLEGELKEEQTAREIAEERARAEEVVRKQAEQRETNERLAKEAQQRETEIQTQRAEQEERNGVLELAKTHPQIKAIVSGELKFYIDPLPSYVAPGVSSEVTNIATAFSSLTVYGASVRRVYNINDADLTISWIRDYGSHTIGEAIYRAHVKVGLGSNNCVGDWSAFDASTVKKVLWHELGHSMGYGHSSNSNNVMYSETDTRFEVYQNISEVISGGWYYTTTLCNAGTYQYSFEAEGAYSGFDLFVLPPGQDAYEISGGSGIYYPDCSKKDMHSYSNSCTVANGAKIYIGNTSFEDTIRVSGEIIDMNNISWPDMAWDQNALLYNKNDLTRYWNLFH